MTKLITQQLLIDADKLSKEVLSLKIDSQETLNNAGQYTSNLKKIGKLIKEEYDNATKPQKEHIKRLQVVIKPYNDALKASEALLKSKILQYSKILETQKSTERQEYLKTIDPFDESQENKDKLAKFENSRIDKTSIRRTRDIEIMDETLIPREYLLPDLKKIKADVCRIVKPVTIPGVKMVIKESVAIRS